jgi:hypothetical protein
VPIPTIGIGPAGGGVRVRRAIGQPTDAITMRVGPCPTLSDVAAPTLPDQRTGLKSRCLSGGQPDLRRVGFRGAARLCLPPDGVAGG